MPALVYPVNAITGSVFFLLPSLANPLRVLKRANSDSRKLIRLLILSTSYTKISEKQKEKAVIALEKIIKGIQRAVKEGIKVGLGNDAAVPFVTHYDLWREIDIRIKLAGITPAEALYQATLANAEILGIDSCTGSIEVGKRADFIVFDGDPVQDTGCLSRPQMVIVNGHVISSPIIQRNKDIDGILNGIDWS